VKTKKNKSWWIDFDTYDGGYIVGPDGDEPIVVVFADNRSEKPNKRKLMKALKTAAVVSAAPDLLEALEEVLPTIDEGSVHFPKIKAALAKARGGS
jgi:hypothetical protein